MDKYLANGIKRFDFDDLLRNFGGPYKSITIVGHDNIDIDAALSGILLSRLFDFLEIKNNFIIWEHIKQESDTYKVVKELIGIDLKEFEKPNEFEYQLRSLFLVDHYQTYHEGFVFGCIDHHPTIQENNCRYLYVRQASATAYLIYELMKEVKYPIGKQEALMIVTAMMADTVCFKSTKARMDEYEVAQALVKEYDLNWGEIECSCISETPIDKMSVAQIVENGLKVYPITLLEVCAAYIQVYGMPERKLIDTWLAAIRSYRCGMYVFLIFDLKNNLTYEYQTTSTFTKEIVHHGILSRGQNIMPRIERELLAKESATWTGNWIEKRLSEIVGKLSSENKTIATMESCTGGQLASEITNISGASEILKESYITYSNEAKIKCGVSKDIIKKYTVYSAETAVEMANAVCKLAGSDIGVGITGQLGRIDPNNPGANDNEVWYAMKFKGHDACLVRKLTILRETTRAEKKKIVVEAIVDTLYELLIE